MPENRLYWLDKETLAREHRIARKLVEDQGIVISKDAAAYELARAVFEKVALAMKDILFVSLLRLVYVFDVSEQPKDHEISHCDGFSCASERLEDGKRVASIGIAKHVLQGPEEYAVLVFLHELAHVTIEGVHSHDKLFHEWLDYLIEKFNKFHGTQIVNDYFGL